MIAVPSFCAATRRIGAIRVVEAPVDGSAAVDLSVEADTVVLGSPGTLAAGPLRVEDAFDYDECLAELTCRIHRALRGLGFSGAAIRAALVA